jgi:hypothetical protein
MERCTYNKVIFTSEQQEQIKQMYLNGLSSVKIGKIFGRSHHTILNFLHENNIDVDQKKFVRKYKLDEHYMDNIDTQEKAYIFGFLCADGHNASNKGTISMCLQEGDKEILERIRQCFKSEKPLEFIDYTNKHDFGYTYQNQWRINLFSAYLCKKLEEQGMMPMKSDYLKFPNFREDLIPHFVRGYFDGNGSILYRTLKSLRISIVSTKDFCTRLQQIVQSTLNIVVRLQESQNHNGITTDFYITRYRDSIKFLHWIYKDATIYLQRKYDKYIFYCNTNNLLLA